MSKKLKRLKENKKIGILIPCYNECATIKKVVSDSLKTNHPVVVVIDGSTDNSLEIVRGIKGVKILINKKNKGLTYSLNKGFKYFLSKKVIAVIKLDGDGQMEINKIPQIIDKFQKGKFDVISATTNDDPPWMIKKDISIYSWLIRAIFRSQIPTDILSDYRLFSRKAIKIFLESDLGTYSSNLIFIDFLQKKLKIGEIYGGVEYNISAIRPFYLGGLIDLRITLFKKIWNINGIKFKVWALFSALVLIILLIFNVTFGFRYNSVLSKEEIRK